MPRVPSDTLFRLIKSMTRAEKLVFRRQAGDKGRIYLALFDHLDSQTAYDERKAMRKLSGLIPGKRYADVKNYLFNAILGSVSAQSPENGNTALIRRWILNAEALYAKGLYKAALKMLDKAGRLAEAVERFPLQLEILALQRKISFHMLPAGKYFKRSTELAEREAEVHAKISNHHAYSRLAARMSYLARTRGMARTEEQRKEMAKAASSPLLRDESRALSFSSLVHYCRVNAVYASHAGNEKRSLFYSRRLVKHFEERPVHIDDKPDIYIGALYNETVSYDKLRDFDSMLNSVRKMKAFNESRRVSQPEAVILTLLLEQGYYTYTGRYEESRELLSGMDEFLRRHKAWIGTDDLIVILLNTGELHFGLGHLRKARHYLSHVLNLPESDLERSDLYVTAKLVNVIYCFEENNLAALDEAIRSVYRYLLRKKRIFAFEETMLAFFRKILKAGSREEVFPLLKELKKKLEKLAGSSFEFAPVHSFPFIPWIESKISGRNFAVLVREYSARCKVPS